MNKLLAVCIISFLSLNLYAVKAERGVLDISAVNLNQRTVALDGEWRFHWMQYVNEVQGVKGAKKQAFIPYTYAWSDLPQLDGSVHAKGYASYVLDIRSDEDLDDLALYIPEVYSAYELYLNGSFVSQNGNPTTSAETTEPFWLPKVARIKLKEGDNRLVLHIANFHHHQGGAMDPIQLGTFATISNYRNYSTSGALFISGALLIAAVFSFTVFYFQRIDRSFLFFALFGLVYTYRLLGTDTYFLHELFDHFSWFFAIRLEYFSLFGSITAFAYFFYYLSDYRVPGLLVHLLAGLSAFMSLMLFLPVETFSSLINFYLIVVLLFALVILSVYLYKVRGETKISWPTFLSISSLTFVLMIKMAGHFNWLSEFIHLDLVGYTLFVFSQAVALSQRFGANLVEEMAKSQEARSSQRNFLNSVSHELRTPMNAILGLTDFLRKEELSKEQARKVDSIAKNGEDLNALLLDLLNFSEIDSGEIKLEYRRVNIVEEINKTVDQIKGKYASKKLGMDLTIDPDIPEELVADQERVNLVLNHLLDNAFKFTSEGHISLHVSLAHKDDNIAALRFNLTDTGKGIGQKELDRVLEAFYQGDAGNTRKFGGTGLGLTLSANLVEVMGGEMWIDSKPEKGTTVEFEINLRIPRMDFSKEKDAVLADREKLPSDLKILYAEDNPINQKLLKMMMKSLGYEIDIAENGMEAWEMAIKNRYHIIFMDVQMPKMDGIEATKRIIKDIANRPVIIAVTANAGVADQQRCMEAGMNDFIPKPFNAKTLKEGLIKWKGLTEYMNDGDNDDDVLQLIS